MSYMIGIYRNRSSLAALFVLHTAKTHWQILQSRFELARLSHFCRCLGDGVQDRSIPGKGLQQKMKTM